MLKKNLCQYLKDLRKFHSYSQKDVASYLHITRQTYSHYETGRIIPPTNAIYHLAKLYEIPSDIFLELIVGSVSDDGAEQVQQERNVEAAGELSLSPKHIYDFEEDMDLKHLSEKEWQMLSYYRLMNEQEQNKILHFFKGMCQSSRQED